MEKVMIKLINGNYYKTLLPLSQLVRVEYYFKGKIILSGIMKLKDALLKFNDKIISICETSEDPLF